MNPIDCFRLITGISNCVFCGKQDGVSLVCGLCRPCLDRVEKECHRLADGYAHCECCGMKLLSEKGLCLQCRGTNSPVRNSTLYPYRGMGKDLIRFYKFEGDRRLALLFSRLIHRHLFEENLRDYVLVPVPPSRRKIFRTGWDQMDLIAAKLMRMGWTVEDLLRKKGGASQKLLSREQRQKAVSGRYYAPRRIRGIPERILILDDVYTTGATLRECYRILEKQGAKDIRSLTIARD